MIALASRLLAVSALLLAPVVPSAQAQVAPTAPGAARSAQPAKGSQELDNVRGRYTGSYSMMTVFGERPVGVTLEITSIEGGKVGGKATRMQVQGVPACWGDYNLQGTLKGKSLVLRSTQKSGPAGDCDMALQLTVSGTKLTGTVDGYSAKFSK